MAVAGTAPAYSIAATTAALVAVAGVQSVGALFYSGLIMFGIALAYARLGAAMPDAGAGYTWVGRVFGPVWGFFAGWGMLVSAVVFTVSATVPAAQATLKLVAPAHVDSTAWVAAVGACWFTVITAITARGIRHASWLQVAFTIVEAAVILAIVVAAFRMFWAAPVHAPSLAWVSPFAFTASGFAAAAMVGVFFYWGWDVAANLAEETRAGHGPASRSMIWAMVALILLFVLLMVVVLIALSDAEIAAADTNVLFAVAQKLFPAPWSYLAVLSTLLSTVGTIETQVLQLARALFAMGRDGTLHPRHAHIHPRWHTPLTATAWQWALGMLLLYGSTYLPSVGAILQSSINAIGLQICFYMSVTGFACAWHFRGAGGRAMFTAIVWPLLSALFLVFVALWTLPTLDPITAWIGVGGLLLGIVPYALNRSRSAEMRSAGFRPS